MTIIVYDGKTLATDKLVIQNGKKAELPKAWYDKGVIFAGVGDDVAIATMWRWWCEAEMGDEPPMLADVMEQLNAAAGAMLIVVNNDGLRYYSQPWRAVHIGKRKCAFGSGSDFAYGALYMGATAVQAVEAANEHSLYCGKGVETYELKI